MLGMLLGFLGIGGVSIIVLGLAARFGLLSWVPGAIANILGYLVELVFRLLSWTMETLLAGEGNIWTTWTGAFAYCFTAFVCSLWGYAPLMALLSWGAPHMPSFHLPWPFHSAQTEEAPDSLLSAPAHHKSFVSRGRKYVVPAKPRPAPVESTFSSLQHQLGL